MGDNAVDDFAFDHDCTMDKEEWGRFSRDVLLLDV